MSPEDPNERPHLFVRRALLLAALGVCLLAGPAAGDTPSARQQADALVAEGVAEGQAGRIDLAIDCFRRAEAVFSRAIHECNIGLAFALSKRFGEALHYLDRCQARSTEVLPKWVKSESRNARERVRSNGSVPVEIVASPPETRVAIKRRGVVWGANASLAVPLTVWLEAGDYALEARASGYRLETQAVTVKGPSVRLSLALQPETVLALRPLEPETSSEARLPPSQTPLPPQTSRVAGWVTLGAGIGLAVLGGVFHGLTAQEAQTLGSQTYEDTAAFDRAKEPFEAYRAVTLTGYGLGAAGIAAGIWLLVDPPGDP